MVVTKDSLIKQQNALYSYLLSKFDASDWHGVSDAANDLREIEAKLEVLEQIKGENNAE